MTETKTPREGCEWTDARCEQLYQLERLLSEITMLNNGSNFIGRVKECIDIATKLRRWELESGKSSFVRFLNEQALEDRFPKGGA